MKAGTRLKSTVCDTEVVIIKTGGTAVECGGAPMAAERPAQQAAVNPAFAAGTKIGKRYVDAANTLELLCIKAGAGSLSSGGVALQLREAKPLPSSD